MDHTVGLLLCAVCVLMLAAGLWVTTHPEAASAVTQPAKEARR